MGGNGQIGLNHFTKAMLQDKPHPFDVILMDLQMPVMDGLDATMAIRNLEVEHNLRPTPVIALTANAMANDKKRCWNVGMSEFLAKPFKKAALLQKLSKFTPKVELK